MCKIPQSISYISSMVFEYIPTLPSLVVVRLDLTTIVRVHNNNKTLLRLQLSDLKILLPWVNKKLLLQFRCLNEIETGVAKIESHQ